ncbi:dehydrogenase [Rhizobium sp. BR 362]|uniref:dehydrogenase n=1 Tax=Rhizobium sp. BR 362 TaxID=3040670 RepID=UPI002F42DB71
MGAELAEVDEPEFDPVDIALAFCGGDARTTIGALLQELQFVRGQLALTEAGMSVGFTRGWKPSFEGEAR